MNSTKHWSNGHTLPLFISIAAWTRKEGQVYIDWYAKCHQWLVGNQQNIWQAEASINWINLVKNCDKTKNSSADILISNIDILLSTIVF